MSFQPFAGGSIYNVAIALGRQGIEVGYFGGISEDFFGQILLDGLKESNVNTEFVAITKNPSTLAFVSIENSQPRYAFFDNGSAGRMLSNEQLPILPQKVSALHFGSFSLINDPAASVYEYFATNNAKDRIISLDPNIRPTLVSDRGLYLQRLQRMVELADIIKISDEDLNWMFPGGDDDIIAQNWIEQGASLVIITRGAKGAMAYSANDKYFQPAIPTKVCDSVGAGDTFSAAILASLEKQNLLDKQKLAKISSEQIKQALLLASRSAAITISRAGANPPWKHELAQT